MDLNTTKFITGLWDLPSQPLPKDEEDGARVVVIIWLVVTSLFVLLFFREVSPLLGQAAQMQSAMKSGLRSVMWAAILLSLRYLILVIDRWLHYNEAKTPFGYILVDAVFEPLDLGSTILMFWGTYLLIGNQVAGFMTEKKSNVWGLLPRGTVLVLCYVAVAYFIAYVSEAAVWMSFFEVDLIERVAKLRTAAELAMRTLFFVTTILLLGLASFGWWKISNNHRDSHEVIAFLTAATFFLLVRNTFSLGVYGPKGRRSGLLLERDVVYGLFSELYFSFIYWSSRKVAGAIRGSMETRDCVESDIRKAIVEKLDTDTDNGFLQTPAFSDLLNAIGEDATLNNIITTGTLSHNMSVNEDSKRAFATAYIETLRKDYGEMNPRNGMNYENTRPQSVPNMLLNNLGRLTAKGRHSAASKSRRTGTASPGDSTPRPRLYQSTEKLRGLLNV